MVYLLENYSRTINTGVARPLAVQLMIIAENWYLDPSHAARIVSTSAFTARQVGVADPHGAEGVVHRPTAGDPNINRPTEHHLVRVLVAPLPVSVL
jgi:hypothetical protein